MKGKKHLTILTLVILLIIGAACGDEKESSTAPAEDQPSTVSATMSPTQSPTDTPMVTPSNTSTPVPTFTPSNTPTPAPTFTPTPVPIGRSRSSPVPLGDVYQTADWELQVLEYKRGNDAWVDIQIASRYNNPPPEGMEYVLVKMRAKNISTEEVTKEINDWSFALTGDRNLVYDGMSWLQSPEPELDAELYPGGETEGWIVMLAFAGDFNLVLIYEGDGDEETLRFFALEGEGIPYGPVEPCEGIYATTRGEPAPFGEKVCAGSWEVRVLEVIRGADAWAALQAVSGSNDPPGEGMEYVLVKLYARNISLVDRPILISRLHFASVGDKSVVYDSPYVYHVPNPVIGKVKLFPGGEIEGWFTLQCAEGEGSLVAIFEPEYGASAFLTLE